MPSQLGRRRPGSSSRPTANTVGYVACWARRRGSSAAWRCSLFYLRISFTGHVSSDGANSALQAWDMLHGHLLLHGWIIGDATYYTLTCRYSRLLSSFPG